MKIITKRKFFEEKNYFNKIVLDGAVFIYPTDTIYGLGCNATLSSPVRRIRKIKSRDKNPFSVMAPSKSWIRENCLVSDEGIKYLRKLPGKFTFIFNIKKKALAKEVNPSLDTLGVRMPKHWFAQVTSELNIPILSTSVNISGEKPMTSLKDLNASIRNSVDFIVYEGKKAGKPSVILDLREKAKIVRR